MAVSRSSTSGSMNPKSANRARVASSPSTAMANDSGDGSKSGIVRWNSNW